MCLVISEAAQIVKAIRKNDFLRRLDEEQISMMVELMKVLDCRPGDAIIREGTEGDSMYIVAGVYVMLNSEMYTNILPLLFLPYKDMVSQPVF